MNSGRPAVLPDRAVAGQGAVAIGPLAAGLYRGAVGRLLAVWELWLLMALALVPVFVYLQAAPLFGLPFDDSYISLHFGRNLARHGFLTFDGETASAGATSLLHVALLAVPIKLGVAPVKASVALGIVSHVALLAALYWLSWSIFRDRLAAALAAGSAGVMGYLVFDALNGMETTLFLVVTTAAAAAFFSAEGERGVLAAGVLAALGVLTRPEGALLVAAMALYYVVNPDRGSPVIAPGAVRRLALLTGPSVLALIGLASFYWATTDALTPGTATAKYLFFREFELPVSVRGEFIQSGVGNFFAPVLPWLGLALFAARRREALLFAFFWIAFIFLYFMLFPGGIGHYWYRYQHVFLPAIIVFGAGGLVSIVRSHRFRVWDLVPATIIGAALLGAVAFQYNDFRNNYTEDIRINETRQVGMARFLREISPPDATIATHDIGAIGFYSEREVIDLVGLANPDVIDYHDGRRLREYVDRVQPDYIVVFPSWEERYLRLGLGLEPELFKPVRLFEGGLEPFVVYETNYGAPAAVQGNPASR